MYHAGKIGKDGEWVLDIMKNAGVDTSYTKVSKTEVKKKKKKTGLVQFEPYSLCFSGCFVGLPGTKNP